MKTTTKTAKTGSAPAAKAYQVVTDRICSILESGTIPWRRPWTSDLSRATNIVSGKAYQGVNDLVLNSAGYDSPYWATFRQIRGKGGSVRKGEHGFPVVYWGQWSPKDKDEDDDEARNDGRPHKRSRWFLRYSIVFNADQTDNLKLPERGATATVKTDPHKIVSDFIARDGQLKLAHGLEVVGKDVAAYMPDADIINMPPSETFFSPENYHCSLFHELTHATGAPHRLGRDLGMAFGRDSYSREELIAEMGACFLAREAGISCDHTDELSAAYIANWLEHLREPKNAKMVVEAAAAAGRAVDLVMNRNRKTPSF